MTSQQQECESDPFTLVKLTDITYVGSILPTSQSEDTHFQRHAQHAMH